MSEHAFLAAGQRVRLGIGVVVAVERDDDLAPGRGLAFAQGEGEYILDVLVRLLDGGGVPPEFSLVGADVAHHEWSRPLLLLEALGSAHHGRLAGQDDERDDERQESWNERLQRSVPGVKSTSRYVN